MGPRSNIQTHSSAGRTLDRTPRLSLSLSPRSSADWRAFPIALVCALLLLAQAIWNNDFPVGYNPDESNKVEQILEDDYNFHHPLLMLRSAELIADGLGAGDDPARIIAIGRTVSAAAAAGSVLVLSLLAAYLAGNWAGLAAGLFLASNQMLLELAHYFKEDTSFLFGIAVFFSALALYGRSPSARRAVLVGAALGLALSAKYTALVLAPLALVTWLALARERRWLQAAVAILAMVAVILVVNWPALSQLTTFNDSFWREYHRAAGGHDGIGRPIPHDYYWWLARHQANFVVWLLVGVYLVALWLRRRTLPLAEFLVALFPVAFATLLSFFPHVSFRYFLPVMATMLVLAGIGAAELGHLRRADRPLLGTLPGARATAAAVLLVVAVQLPTLVSYHLAFAKDNRKQLANYLLTHVPAGTPIAQDDRVELQALDLPYPLHRSRYVADLGTIDELRGRGIDLVAVTRQRFGRLFRPNATVAANASDEFEYRRDFYQRLFDEGERLFEIEKGDSVQYLQPHLALYRLPKGSAGHGAATAGPKAVGDGKADR